MENYAGPFDPDFDLGKLSRAALAVLGREYLLVVHLQDRAGLPQVMARFGTKAMKDVAIEEWMGASPVYTARMQRALGFTGNDVATIFKGIQLDVGAPHQFMDFRFTVTDAHHGEFRLAHCGALMDVEPMGEELVRGMCHDIEDPTFDATAVATNPLAQMRPIHRPPRSPAGRLPHCHWRVDIEADGEAAREIPLTARVRDARVSRVSVEAPEPRESGGWADYSGPFDPDFQLEDLAQPAQVVASGEFCLQGHLLVRALMMSVADRFGEDAAREVANAQFTGIAGLGARRLAAAMAIDGDDPAAIAKLLQLHPAFRPREYVDFHVELDPDGVRCWIGPCPAFEEADGYSWLALLGPDPHAALNAMVRELNPRARCHPCDVPGAQVAWRVEIDSSAEPAPEPPEVQLTAISTGASFVFEQRRPVRR